MTTTNNLDAWKGDPYIQTLNGKFFFRRPEESDLSLDTIAAALSRTCRFNGHVSCFYSVAQHSCQVADITMTLTKDPRIALAGLLHDAPEAYIGDVTSPLKAILGSAYKSLEGPILEAIFRKYGLGDLVIAFRLPEVIHDADMIALATEKRDFLPEDPVPWSVLDGYKPTDEITVAWAPQEAQRQFLSRFALLNGLIQESERRILTPDEALHPFAEDYRSEGGACGLV